MILEQFELVAVAAPGLRMIRHPTGALLAHYDEREDRFTTTVSRSLYDAIPSGAIDLSDVPDADDTYHWWENTTLGIFGDDERQWVLEGDRIGTIYFIASADTGMVKIGFTADMKKRLCNYRGHGADDIDVWHMPGNRRLERLLLSRFRPVRRHGEWHYPHIKLIKYALGAEPYVPER